MASLERWFDTKARLPDIGNQQASDAVRSELTAVKAAAIPPDCGSITHCQPAHSNHRETGQLAIQYVL